MRKFKIPNQKHLFLKKYINIVTNPSYKTETKTHRRHHITDILKKVMLVVDTQVVTESNVTNRLRYHSKTCSVPTVLPVRNPQSPPSSLDPHVQKPGDSSHTLTVVTTRIRLVRNPEVRRTNPRPSSTGPSGTQGPTVRTVTTTMYSRRLTVRVHGRHHHHPTYSTSGPGSLQVHP